MLTYAFAITFILGLTLGAVAALYLAYRYFDHQEKADQARAEKLMDEAIAQQGPILHPSQR